MVPWLTIEAIHAEKARRKRVREQERARVKASLKIVPGGKVSAREPENGHDASEGKYEQTASR